MAIFFLSIFCRLTNRGKGRREKGKSSSKQRAMVSELQLSLILEEPHHVLARCDTLQDKSQAIFLLDFFCERVLLCLAFFLFFSLFVV